MKFPVKPEAIRGGQIQKESDRRSMHRDCGKILSVHRILSGSKENRGMTETPNNERWTRVKELFDAALEQAPEVRSAFLKAQCRGDDALRAEVEELIRLDTASGEFLETPAVTDLSIDETGEEYIDTRIGQYLLKRIISVGGMGVVYEAVQEHPRRTVAVKVMKDGIHSRSAKRRFEYESHILARLEHPGIAKVFEAGTFRKEGPVSVPYFVMEYIPDAQPITRYAWGKGLSTHQRLDLLIQACKAVHHGHQKGIIHRDLKPANILVDARGQVKVIDFGVARVTDSDIRLTTTEADLSRLMDTVQYMSPEQCKADPHDLDFRSDVYALGVVLYELLCEQLPYDLGKLAVFEAVRKIREEQPKRPSAIKRTLRGDVETIVLTALEKDRERRYQSTTDLAEDLRRFLGGEVILAKPAGLPIRFWKQIKRNPVTSTSVALVVLALAVFVLYVLLWFYPRIQEERNKAVNSKIEADAQRTTALEALAKLEKSAQNTTDINAFLEDMLLTADPFEMGREVEILEMLDNAAKRIDTEFPDRPDIEISLRNTLGIVYLNNGQYVAAEEQFRKALELCRRTFRAEHPDALKSMSNLARALMDLGRFDDAEELLLDVVEVYRSDSKDDDPNMISSLGSLALLYKKQGRFEEAEPLFLEVLASEHDAAEGGTPQRLVNLGNLAGLYFMQGRYKEAEAYSLKTLEGCRRTLDRSHPYTFTSMSNLATLYRSINRLPDAERLYLEAYEGYCRVLSEDHPKTLTILDNLATLYMYQGRNEEAEPLFLKALDGYRRVLDENHPNIFNTMNNVALLYQRQGRFQEAEPLLLEALEGYRDILGEDHQNTLVARTNLASLYKKMGRFEEAEPILVQALDDCRRVLKNDHPDTLGTMSDLADLYVNLERYGEAEPLYVEALDGYRRILERDDPRYLVLLFELGTLYSRQERFDKAQPLFLEEYEGQRKRLGERHKITLGALHNATVSCVNNGAFEKAEPLARKLLKQTPRDHGKYAVRKNLLDIILEKLGKDKSDG